MASRNLIYSAGILIPAIFVTNPAKAQISLNYDDLSSLEEPLAFEVGPATVLVNGAIDIPVTMEIDDSVFVSDVDVSAIGNFSVNAETQLSNRWNVGVAYFGQYDENTNDYEDNVAGYVRTSWGSFVGGNVNGLVRESTRRARGAGNAALAFDDFYGQLDRWGGGYSGRFGPVIVTGIVDDEGHFEIGTEFQRPIGTRDHRFTTRLARAQFLSADGTTNFDTIGAGLVGELVYGSSLFDLGLGYENLQSGAINLDRWYVSGGGQTKIGSVRLSAAGHYGQVDGQSETSASLGLGYDIARGLSTNLGVNAAKAKIAADGVSVVDEDQTTATASVRYSF